jgi:hypothetical protein
VVVVSIDKAAVDVTVEDDVIIEDDLIEDDDVIEDVVAVGVAVGGVVVAIAARVEEVEEGFCKELLAPVGDAMTYFSVDNIEIELLVLEVVLYAEVLSDRDRLLTNCELIWFEIASAVTEFSVVLISSCVFCTLVIISSVVIGAIFSLLLVFISKPDAASLIVVSLAVTCDGTPFMI